MSAIKLLHIIGHHNYEFGMHNNVSINVSLTLYLLNKKITAKYIDKGKCYSAVGLKCKEI